MFLKSVDIGYLLDAFAVYAIFYDQNGFPWTQAGGHTHLQSGGSRTGDENRAVFVLNVKSFQQFLADRTNQVGKLYLPMTHVAS